MYIEEVKNKHRRVKIVANTAYASVFVPNSYHNLLVSNRFEHANALLEHNLRAKTTKLVSLVNYLLTNIYNYLQGMYITWPKIYKFTHINYSQV